MPLKKKRISEMNEANDMKGFFTIGYRIVNGVKTSLKFGLEKIQTALDNMLKATSDAKTATTDIRQLEATVEGNESTRETAESRRNASEQSRQTAETGRSREEQARETAESVRVTNENTRKTAETGRSSAESIRVTEEGKRVTAENARESNEQARKIAETSRFSAESARVKEEDKRKTAESVRSTTETERIEAESKRKSEYAGIVQEMTSATDDATAQLELVKKATNDANAAKNASVEQTALAKKATDAANTAAGSVNAAKDAATTAAAGANAAKTESEAQTALAKKATDDANAAKNASVTQTGLAKKATDDANAAALAANNAVSGVDGKVKAAVDALVAGAPDALDTLIELANALNNDPNFAATMAKELGKKLNITDIVNNLTTGGSGKALSAEQGKTLKVALDSHNHDAVYEKIITKLTAFNKNFGTAAGTVCQGNDARLSNARTPLAHTHKKADISDFPTSMPASDVPAWAKAATKPTYTASEVGASLSSHNHAGTYEPVFTKNSAFNKNLGTAAGTVCEGNDARLSDTRVPKAHTHKKSDISDFPTSMPASDVSAWAKTASKPSYTASEVGASPSNHTHTGVYQPAGNYAPGSHSHGATDITPDGTHRFVTDTEKETWNSKAAGNHNHDSVYQPKGSYAPSSHKHVATDITDDTTHRFVTDSEKVTWNSKAEGNHNHDSVYQPKGSYAASSHKHTSTDVEEDSTHRFMTDAERTKLNGIASGANNYSHPASHPASMIEESTTRKFMTDAEKTLLSSLGTNAALKDFSNVTTKSLGQNGYYKLPDGLMIQWGYSSSSGRNKTIYLPASFYDTNYSVIITMRRGTDDTTNLTGDVWTQSKSSFLMFGLYHSTDTNNGAYWAGFNWFAVGRWK